MTQNSAPPPISLADVELYEAAYKLPARAAGYTDFTLHDGLLNALRKAMDCEKFIAPETARLKRLLAKARNPTEAEAREYQIWYTKMYLTRAAGLARKRYAHLSTITTQSAVDAELERVKSDKKYWFEMYAWGYDPRARTPLSVVPFELFPTQANLVDWLDETVFELRTSGGIEKARDEGATESIVRWGVWNWLFTEGFSMLLSSRKEDEIDKKENPNTLFQRVRHQLRLVPRWMLPKGFNIDRNMSGDMFIANPENNNTLLGEAPVENMGRGGRVTCAMLDEFAFWRFAGYPQYRSLSQTTDSIIMPSSVAGRLNQYADLMHDGETRKFVMDWRDNPFKDIRWYNALPHGYISPKMSGTTIAQEVDRNYDAAQPGKVFHVREEFVFMSLEEFLLPFEQAKMGDRFFNHDENGQRSDFRIPTDWEFSRWSDYGQSEGHDWSYALSARPSAYYPLNDTQFVFIARNLEPTGLKTAQAVSLWREYEQQLSLRDKVGKFIKDPYASYCSHEQKDLRKVLLHKYGENWHAWKTDYNAGIEQLNDWFTPEEVEKPNPFRPKLMGRCKLVFVSLENDYELAYNDRLSTYFVTMSTTEGGFFTCRRQLSAYHYAETELGKPVKAMRPVKEFDDIVDALRALGVMWNMPSPAMTAHEAYLTHLKENMPNLLPEEINKIGDPERLAMTLAREEFERDEFERKKKRSGRIQDGFSDYMSDIMDNSGNGGNGNGGGFREL